MNEEKLAEIRGWLVKSDHDLGLGRRPMEGNEPYLDTAPWIRHHPPWISFSSDYPRKLKMTRPIIEVENLSKQCRLETIGMAISRVFLLFEAR